MKTELNSLAPKEITPDIILSSLNEWKLKIGDIGFELLDSSSSKISLFFSIIMQYPGAADLELEIPDKDEMEIMSLICEQNMENYAEKLSTALRFRSALQSMNNPEGVTYNYFRNQKNDSIPNFLQNMINIIDDANSRPYIPLPEKAIKAFTKNFIGRFFYSRRLNDAQPFLHLYTPCTKEPFQIQILHSLPLLDAPDLICFAVDETSENPINFNNVPLSVGVPLGVTQDTFSHVCERIFSWNTSKFDEKSQVISAFHESITLETYILFGMIVETSDQENRYCSYITKLGEHTNLSTEAKILCALYCSGKIFERNN